jgi:hypothetical protein
VLGAIFSFVFRGPGDAEAVWLSAAVAVAVQLVAASLGQVVGRNNNVMARMGVGMILRLVALVVYAVLVAKVIMLPAVAALISIAAFFFVTTLLEPLIIKS